MPSDESKFPINQEISERRQRSKSFIDKCIDSLPFEFHLFKYRFAGPGIKLKERLARGERGVNKLDDYCRQHDLCYNDENAEKQELEVSKRRIWKFRAYRRVGNYMLHSIEATSKHWSCISMCSNSEVFPDFSIL